MGQAALNDSLHKVKVIKRNSIPAMTEVVVDGEVHNLGLLLEFGRHQDIAHFLPESGRFAISWVHLKKDQELSVHKHPTSSMIIICEGQGLLQGDLHEDLHEGDIAIVPPNCSHGFVGKGNNGLWALSVQFEGSGLYENANKPRVKFGGSGKFEDTFTDLENDQKIYEKRFMKNPLIKLTQSKRMKEKDVQERLLKVLNYWSDWFQKILAARVATGAPPIFQASAEHHFSEEAGHNEGLFVLRGKAPTNLWEPLLDTSASWFYQRMITGRPATKAILMHCVCEAASCIFHTKAKEVFSTMPHFALHSDLDAEHAKEGFDIIRHIPDLDIHEMRIILQRGWDVFECLASAMAKYAIKGEADTLPK